MEKDPEKEQVGQGWGTNSRSRAKGVKQVDLVDGAIFIERAAVADHGVSVTHDIEFTDGSIALRFKLGPKDDLGVNIADLQEPSVHAGHLCMAKVRLKDVELVDLKTGRMKLENREKRLNKQLSKAEEEAIKSKSKKVQVDLSADTWHQLVVEIRGETMSVSIDGKAVGSFASPGIAHPTKRKLRLAVNRQAWVDDVVVTRL
ncbi:MAG: hypothetical protein R3C05_15685 [Pirellulaceae bacterium]